MRRRRHIPIRRSAPSRRRREIRSYFLSVPPSISRPAARYNSKHDQAADHTRQGYHKSLIPVNPARDLLAYRRTFALAVGAFSAALAGGAVEEVLLHRVAYVGAEFGGGAGDLAAVGGAGVGVVSLGVGTH